MTQLIGSTNFSGNINNCTYKCCNDKIIHLIPFTIINLSVFVSQILIIICYQKKNRSVSDIMNNFSSNIFLSYNFILYDNKDEG